MNNKQALLGMIDAAFDDNNQRTALRNIVEALLGEEGSTAEQPEPWPPAGMPIRVRRAEGMAWFVVWALGDGKAKSAEQAYPYDHQYEIDLSEWDWEYLEAPVVWPRWAVAWVVTQYGEYRFLTNPERKACLSEGNGYIMHIEHRPEEA